MDWMTEFVCGTNGF